MNFIYYLSDGMIPFIFIIIIGYGMLNKVDIFERICKRSCRRLRTVVSILPTLVGLMGGSGNSDGFGLP